MPKSKPIPKPAPPSAPHIFDDVPAAWLLRGLLLILSSIALLFYLTYAGLFYFGQWQLVLHPSHTITATPATASLPFEPVHFGVDATGQPQLTGWWLSATTGARYENFTVLYLHGGDGSLSATVPTLALLHTLGLNIFAVDYRGYGSSAAMHPNEARMTADATTAFNYLTATRHTLPTQIIPFGDGLGATLAAELAAAHHAVPAVILRNPPVDILDTVRHDSRSRLLPMALLFHQRFDIAPTIATLTTPKLILCTRDDSALAALVHSAANPKHAVTLPANIPAAQIDAQQTTALSRFLDEYLSVPPAALPLK